MRPTPVGQFSSRLLVAQRAWQSCRGPPACGYGPPVTGRSSAKAGARCTALRRSLPPKEEDEPRSGLLSRSLVHVKGLHRPVCCTAGTLYFP